MSFVRALFILVLILHVSASAQTSRTTPWVLAGGPQTAFGDAIVPLGDINGNGAEDIAVASPRLLGGTNQVGRIIAYDGRTQATLWTATQSAPFVLFGEEMARLDDVDGDGVRDLAARITMVGSEIVRVLSGADGSTLSEITPSTSTLSMDLKFASLHDVTGDGVREVVLVNVVEPGPVAQPHVRLANPVTGALLPGIVTLIGSAQERATSLQVGPDLTGDGVPEVALGQSIRPGALGQDLAGGFRVIDGLSFATVFDVPGTQTFGLLGQSLLWIDDLDQDGTPEIAVGSGGIGNTSGLVSIYDPTGPSVLSTISSNEPSFFDFGASLALLHGPAGQPRTLVTTVTEFQPPAGQGRAIAIELDPALGRTGTVFRDTDPTRRLFQMHAWDAGDLNGDGRTDLAVSGSTLGGEGFLFLHRARGATPFGTGPTNVHTLAISWSDVFAPNQDQARLTGGAPGVPALFAVGTRQDSRPILGANLLVDLNQGDSTIVTTAFDFLGIATLPVPESTQIALLSASFFAQGFAMDPQAPQGVFASNGIQVTF